MTGWKAVIVGIFMILGSILSLVGFVLGILYGNFLEPLSFILWGIGVFLWQIPLQVLGKISYSK